MHKRNRRKRRIKTRQGSSMIHSACPQSYSQLIHEAYPQSRPVVIIVFVHVVRSSVRPHFSKQNNFQAKAMFSTGETVGLAEWIIDDTCLVSICFLLFTSFFKKMGRTYKVHTYGRTSRVKIVIITGCDCEVGLRGSLVEQTVSTGRNPNKPAHGCC